MCLYVGSTQPLRRWSVTACFYAEFHLPGMNWTKPDIEFSLSLSLSPYFPLYFADLCIFQFNSAGFIDMTIGG